MAEDDVGGPIRLHPLDFLDEGGEVIIGRRDINSYGVFPMDGAELLRHLVDGESLNEAAEWYERTYGECFDQAAFLDTIDELGFRAFSDDSATTGQVPKLLLGQRLGRLVFSRPAWLGYALIVFGALWLGFTDPEFRPQPRHVFFTSYLVAVEVILAVGQLPLILLHEIFHLLAARRIGVHARIRLSYRLYFVVFETQMDGLVLSPRRQRYLPILAGMVADVLLASLLTLSAALLRSTVGPTSVAAAICLALAFTTLVRTALELLLFLRTDLYFLAATLSGCVDLHRTSRQMVANLIWTLLRQESRRHDPRDWDPRDRRAARWYAPLYVLGYAVAAVLLVWVLVPVTWGFVEAAGRALLGADLRSIHFWDACGLLALNSAQPVAAGLLALRSRLRPAAAPSQLSPSPTTTSPR